MKTLKNSETYAVAGGEVDNWDPEVMGNVESFGMNALGLSGEQAGEFANMLNECASGSPVCALWIIDNARNFIREMLKSLSDGSPAPIFNTSMMDNHEGGG